MKKIRETIRQITPGQKTTLSPSEAVAQPESQATDTTRCLDFLERKGKELYGEHFRLYAEDYPLLEKLLAYVSGNGEIAGGRGLASERASCSQGRSAAVRRA